MAHDATSSLSLEALFGYADIDDVTEEDDTTTLRFTLRGDPDGPHWVRGEDLYDCLNQAAVILRREWTLNEIRRNGLSDDDIDRLADADEAWYRGYSAGAQDAAEALISHAVRSANSEPQMAMAGEPVTTSGSALDSVLQQEGAFEALASGDGIAITLALVHPAKIVLA